MTKSLKMFKNKFRPSHEFARHSDLDPLTGLLSRDQFFSAADDYDKLHPDEGVDAIVLNYNKFHLINELYGRNFGDRVLCAIADCVQKAANEHEGIACRYDRYCCLCRPEFRTIYRYQKIVQTNSFL